jgi:hypothetical protein
MYGAKGPNNSEIMAVLLDVETWPNGVVTLNAGHVKNPLKTKYLTAQSVSDTSSPGLGKDGIYRDPWGNPYIITVDLNYDEHARDVFYRLNAVSKDPGVGSSPNGLYGLQNFKDPTGGTDTFEDNDKIMVWSAGPDKMINPAVKANQGANKDNVLSWKQ